MEVYVVSYQYYDKKFVEGIYRNKRDAEKYVTYMNGSWTGEDRSNYYSYSGPFSIQ